MLTIIKIEAYPDGGHGVQSQSDREECWLDGWIAVPEELTQKIMECGGYCRLTIQDGVLTDITPTERPKPPKLEPTEEEKLRADVDYIMAMEGLV